MKIVLVSGGFDPIHSGHIQYFAAAKKLGNILVVGVNSDAWLTRKKGRPFMPAIERTALVEGLRVVDRVIEFDEMYDYDGSAKRFIIDMLKDYPNDEIIFANGGDRNSSNIPEMDIVDSRLSFAFGVGGEDKKNSSSWILQEWSAPKTERKWGHYSVLHKYDSTAKVKELVVQPNACLSMQRHYKRSEIWFVANGTASVYTLNKSTDHELKAKLQEHQSILIDRGEWHMLCNETDQPLKLVEIQYGENCVEEDIERKNT